MFLVNPTGSFIKPRKPLEIARDSAIYSVVSTGLYAYPIHEYFSEHASLSISLRRISVTFSELGALVALFVSIAAGYAAFLYALGSYVNAYGSARVSLPRESALIGRVAAIVVAASFRPFYYALFAFTTMHFFGRVPIELAYAIVRGAFEPIVEAARILGYGFSEVLLARPEYALEAGFVRRQNLASYLVGSIFFGSAVMAGALAETYLGLAAVLIRAVMTAITFASRVLIDALKKRAYVAFVSALIHSEAPDRVKAYVLTNVKLSSGNALKIAAIVASILANLAA